MIYPITCTRKCNLKVSWGIFKLDFLQLLPLSCLTCRTPSDSTGLAAHRSMVGDVSFIFSRGVKDRKIVLIGMIYRCLPVLCGSDSLQGMYFQVMWMSKHWKNRPIKKFVRNLLSFNSEEPALWPWLPTGVEGGWIGQIRCKDQMLRWLAGMYIFAVRIIIQN